MVRSEMVDVLHRLRSRRVAERPVAPTHPVAPCAARLLLPTITIVALDVGYLLGGIVVVEEILPFPVLAGS